MSSAFLIQYKVVISLTYIYECYGARPPVLTKTANVRIYAFQSRCGISFLVACSITGETSLQPLIRAHRRRAEIKVSLGIT